MSEITINIRPRLTPTEGQVLKSNGYDVTVNDWKLGRGVTDFKLEMPAGEKPKATITFVPSIVEIESVAAEVDALIQELQPESEI